MLHLVHAPGPTYLCLDVWYILIITITLAKVRWRSVEDQLILFDKREQLLKILSMLDDHKIFCSCLPGAHHDKLSEMIGQLSEAMTGVKHEQEYMEVRERIHRASKRNHHSWLKVVLLVVIKGPFYLKKKCLE